MSTFEPFVVAPVWIAILTAAGLALGGLVAWLVASARHARLEQQLSAERDATAEKLQLLHDAEKRLSDTFQVLADQALRTSKTDFLELARTQLGTFQSTAIQDLESRQKAIDELVTPIRESLGRVDERYTALAKHIDLLASETTKLGQALRTSTVRGRWGEIQLRRVVELAGMLEHCDFDEQTTLAGVDGRLRPDMVIHLPGGRRIVVDAKAPLGAYLEAREAPDDEARAAKYRQHAAQVRAHMQKLGAKSYWEALDAAPDMVVMFLPGEPLYSVALEQMPELMEEGQAQKVLVATPMTLIALLRTASFGWREERLAENAQRISDEGRRLHERIATVMEHFADLGNALNQSVKHFNKSLRSFEQRVVVSARRLDELDARGKKEIAPLEEIEARAVGPELADKPEKAERTRRLTQQPLLTLAPPPDPER
jgi:DNA recombination protein RmuC